VPCSGWVLGDTEQLETDERAALSRPIRMIADPLPLRGVSTAAGHEGSQCGVGCGVGRTMKTDTSAVIRVMICSGDNGPRDGDPDSGDYDGRRHRDESQPSPAHSADCFTLARFVGSGSPSSPSHLIDVAKGPKRMRTQR